MNEVTVYPQKPSTSKEEEQEQKTSLSASLSFTSENPLFSIDPLLLIQICSFLDMLSVMRFECVSLRFYKFIQKHLSLQSMDQSNTDYFIDHALKTKTQNKNKSNDKAKDIIPIFSSLKYRFPNLHQYEHYILLETDKNIFGAFQHIKELHLRIIPPNSTDFVSNPSSSYLSKIQKHRSKISEQKQEEEEERTTQQQQQQTAEEDAVVTAESEIQTQDNLDFALLHSAKHRQYASRPPITKVETSIYSRSILSYFDNYFSQISHLIIEFNPYMFTSQFLAFNIPKILSKISKLSLIKCLPSSVNSSNYISSKDIYCHETVSLLQYTRQLRELVFNFPLSSDFYPIIDNLESLKIMHRIEQPVIGKLFAPNSSSPYAQNIATINANNTTIISNVKLQKSMIQYFCPSITSLHFHGSKGVQQLFVNNLQYNGDDERLTRNVLAKHKVFFGLRELCIHCSDSIYRFIAKHMSVTPQLRRLQLVFGKNCSIHIFLLILQHFEANFVLNYTYNPKKDSLLSYYYKYYIYYGYSLENRANQLRHIQVVTKKTSHFQNYQLLNGLCEFLKQSKMTLLHIRLLVHYQYWSTADLMNVIELFASNHVVFGRDSMSYQIIMPLKRKYAKHAAFGSEQQQQQQNGKSKVVKEAIKKMKDEYEYEQQSKYEKMRDDECSLSSESASLNGVIDRNSLKGIASYVKQKNVGKLQIISSQNGMRDEDIVIIEKLRVQREERQKYESYKDFYSHSSEERREKGDDRNVYKEKIAQRLLEYAEQEREENDKDAKAKMFVENLMKNKNDSTWINECYYCDLLK